MSLITCTESECIDKILTDYEEKVASRDDYYFWANRKYQTLMKLLTNPRNSQLVYKALNFITYLDSVSLVDKKLKKELQWEEFFEWDREDFKKSLKEEFDPVGQERRKIGTGLKVIKCAKEGNN